MISNSTEPEDKIRKEQEKAIKLSLNSCYKLKIGMEMDLTQTKRGVEQLELNIQNFEIETFMQDIMQIY